MSRSGLIPARLPPRRIGFQSDMRNCEKKIKRLPAGVRRIRQTRKVCLNEEVKFRGDEKRPKISFLDKEVASSQSLAVFCVAVIVVQFSTYCVVYFISMLPSQVLYDAI